MRRPSWLTRNLLVLSAVSLTQDAASELVYPLLPLLLTGVMAAPPVVVGIVEGVAEGVASITKYLSGRLSDRRGRRPLVGLGYGLAAVGKVVVAAAWAWPVVLVGRVVDRIGKGVRGAPRDALLAQDVEPGAMGRVFGFHRAMDTLGAVIGPSLGLLVLATSGGDVRQALWWAVVPAVLSAGLVLLTREHHAPAGPTPGATAPEEPTPAQAPAEPTTAQEPVAGPAAGTPGHRWTPEFRRVVFALAAVSLVNVPDALVLLRLSDIGYSATGVVGAYVLYNAVYAALSYPAGALADRVPRRLVYAAGLACFTVGLGGLAVVDSPGPLALALLLVYGGFNGLTDGVGKAWITSLVPARDRGRAQGIFQGLAGGGVFVAGLWAGLSWGVGPGDGAVPLAVAASVTGVAGLAMAVGWRWRTTGMPRRPV